MKVDVGREVAALELMTAAELRDKFAEVFGESTNANNRTWLVRRIAWRLQANEEGGLSDRALARATELAARADLRVTAPAGSPQAPPPATGPVRTGTIAGAAADPRVPPVGTILVRKYKGTEVRVIARSDGFEFDGRIFHSLSAAAQAVTGSHCNGFAFFRLDGKGGRR